MSALVQKDISHCNRHVCFGSKADMCRAHAHVRFTPESDIKCDIMECPLWAKSRYSALHALCLLYPADIRLVSISPTGWPIYPPIKKAIAHASSARTGITKGRNP